MGKMGSDAVVLGTSVVGLLPARVLAGSYDRVTIAGRDPLPESGPDRRRVPQGRGPCAVAARRLDPPRAALWPAR
jgi:hypothetical protein